MSNLSEYTIRDMMRKWESLNTVLENVPDEFFKRANGIISYLESSFLTRIEKSREEYIICKEMGSRKEQAERLQKNSSNAWIVFWLIDWKYIGEMIRKTLTPKKTKFLSSN
jgi:hypothetical protein